MSACCKCKAQCAANLWEHQRCDWKRGLEDTQAIVRLRLSLSLLSNTSSSPHQWGADWFMVMSRKESWPGGEAEEQSCAVVSHGWLLGSMVPHQLCLSVAGASVHMTPKCMGMRDGCDTHTLSFPNPGISTHSLARFWRNTNSQEGKFRPSDFPVALAFPKESD